MISITQDEEKRYEQLQLMALDFARVGNVIELSRMIEAGLSIDLCDNKGNSLIMLASYHNQEEMVSFLIKNGALVDKKNDRGQTPLAGVCFKGYLNIVKLLVENGANKYEDNGLGATPVTFASLFGHEDIVLYLTKKKPKKIYSFLSSIILFIKSLKSDK